MAADCNYGYQISLGFVEILRDGQLEMSVVGRYYDWDIEDCLLLAGHLNRRDYLGLSHLQTVSILHNLSLWRGLFLEFLPDFFYFTFEFYII